MIPEEKMTFVILINDKFHYIFKNIVVKWS